MVTYSTTTGNATTAATLADVTAAIQPAQMFKYGLGTVVLGNVAYVKVDQTTLSAIAFPWFIGRGTTTSIFDGAIRETGSDDSNSFSARAVKIQGGVLEFGTAPRAISLGTAVGQLDMSGNGGGGFAAFGANRTVDLNGGAAVTWNSGNFVSSAHALIFGSTTANATAVFPNDIAMGGPNISRYIATVRGTGTAPEGEISGVISSGSGGSLYFTGMLKPDNTPLAAGTLLVSNPNNSYPLQTVVRSGTVLAGGDAPGVAGNGVFGNSTTAILLGDTRSTQAAVRAASTSNLTGTFNLGVLSGVAWITLDSVTLVAGDRVLLKNQSTSSQNGIYTFDGAGFDGLMQFTRVVDSSVNGRQVQVTNGATQPGRTYYVSGSNTWSLDTDPNAAALDQRRIYDRPEHYRRRQFARRAHARRQ